MGNFNPSSPPPTPYLFSPLNTELNPICHLLALLGAHRVFHISGLRVKPQVYMKLWMNNVNVMSEYNFTHESEVRTIMAV